jgi:glycosyltransferase involved in cell wall biosynthesis
MQEFLISIVIPTKNRHKQLIATLEAQSIIPNLDQIEIVISDNSSEPLSEIEVNKLKMIYPHFTYVHDHVEKTIIGNFSAGLNHASGKFMMFIGDDDFFLPEIVAAAKYAENENFSCVIYDPDRYYWENCIFAESGLKYGPKTLIRSNKSISGQVDVALQLKKSALNGFLTIEALPRAYHGLISRAKLLEIVDDNGMLYGGSPDISMAVNLALIDTNTYFWNKPLSIYGASTGSGGGMTTSKTHLLPLHEAKFLSKDFVSTWDSRMPAYWSEYTVFPASAIYIYARRNVPLKNFNLASVYASIFVNELSMFKSVFSAYSKLNSLEKFKCAINFPRVFIRKLAGYLYRSVFNRITLKSDRYSYVKCVKPEDALMQYQVFSK